MRVSPVLIAPSHVLHGAGTDRLAGLTGQRAEGWKTTVGPPVLEGRAPPLQRFQLQRIVFGLFNRVFSVHRGFNYVLLCSKNVITLYCTRKI